MFDLDKFQEIWITITHNKSRSVLTAFGIFWGMFMLVAMVGAGVALEKGISSQIEGFVATLPNHLAKKIVGKYHEKVS